jgi:hypothetical protein
MVDQADSVKFYSPNSNVAFCGRDEREVLEDRFDGNTDELISSQRSRRRTLIKELSNQGVPRKGQDSALVNIERDFLGPRQEEIDDGVKETQDEVLEKFADNIVRAMNLRDERKLPNQISVPEIKATNAVDEKPEPSSVEPVAETVVAEPEEEKPILSFETAKSILAPLMDKMQGQISVDKFEEAYRYFVQKRSTDLEKTYSQERAQRAKSEKSSSNLFTLEGAKARLKEIKTRIKSGGEGAGVLSEALAKQGFDVDDVEALGDAAEAVSEVADETKKELLPFELNLARVFFFLKQNAPELEDAQVFDQLAVPLFELIAKRANNKKDLMDPRTSSAYKKQQSAKTKKKSGGKKIEPKDIQKFQKRFEASKKEIYNFILEKVDASQAQQIQARLAELN